MDVYVISLKRRPDRLADFYKLYPGDKDAVKVFEAVDGKDYKLYTLDDIEKYVLNRVSLTRNISIGVFGCFASHYRLWKQLAGSDYPDNYRYLVYEDDAFFVNNYMKTLATALEGDVPEFDILYLGGRFYPGYTETQATRYNSTNFYRCMGHRGTFSYIITKQGAKNIIKNLEKKDYYRVEVDTVLNGLRASGKVIGYDLFPHINWSPMNYKSDVQVIVQENIKLNSVSKPRRPTMVHVKTTAPTTIPKPLQNSAKAVTVSVGGHRVPQKTHKILRK